MSVPMNGRAHCYALIAFKYSQINTCEVTMQVQHWEDFITQTTNTFHLRRYVCMIVLRLHIVCRDLLFVFKI